MAFNRLLPVDSDVPLFMGETGYAGDRRASSIAGRVLAPKARCWSLDLQRTEESRKQRGKQVRAPAGIGGCKLR